MRCTYFFSGEIYFWYVNRCGENEWIVTSKKEFDEDKDCPGRWLWKQSQGRASFVQKHVGSESFQ